MTVAHTEQYLLCGVVTSKFRDPDWPSYVGTDATAVNRASVNVHHMLIGEPEVRITSLVERLAMIILWA